MTIIQIEGKNGFHDIQSQSHRVSCWIHGYVVVPPNLESAVWDTGGWCDLTIDGDSLVGITPTEKPNEPVEETEPTTAELLNILLGVGT